MTLDIINPADWPHWNDLVLATDGYSFFHSANWAQVLCATYNYKPAYFTLHREGKLQALIPFMEVKSFLTGRRGVSLSFADYCEPVAESKEVFNFMLECIIEYGKKSGWEYIEFRGGQQFLSNTPVYATYLGHNLALTKNEQDLLSTFRDSTRRNIRKAINAGVEVKIYTDYQSVRDFYRLHCLTRKRHGLPPQPFLFFKNIYENVISKNHGFVILATYNKKIIAGSVNFHFGNKAIYKFGASDKSYQYLRANNLIIWEAIKWYSRSGFSTLCFGKTEGTNDGLIQFKNGWGTDNKLIHYYRYDFKKEGFYCGTKRANVLSNILLQNLPILILKEIGHHLYKYVG